MKKLQWTTNDICYDPESKVILGQVTCNGTNYFKAIANGHDLGSFVDRQTAIDRVTHVATIRRNNND
jgi:hypothetical protein